MIQVEETHDFASAPEAPALAREAIGRFAEANGVDEARADLARLLGSELVTNAFVDEESPAGAPIRLRLAATAGTIWIAVSNGGKTGPPAAIAGLQDGEGFGLHLVETASSRWGVHSNGKTHVWAELDPDDVAAQFEAGPFRERLSESQSRQLAALRIEHQDHGISVSVEALTSSHRLVVALEAGRLQQLVAIAPSGEREDDTYIREQLPGAGRRGR